MTYRTFSYNVLSLIVGIIAVVMTARGASLLFPNVWNGMVSAVVGFISVVLPIRYELYDKPTAGWNGYITLGGVALAWVAPNGKVHVRSRKHLLL